MKKIIILYFILISYTQIVAGNRYLKVNEVDDCRVFFSKGTFKYESISGDVTVKIKNKKHIELRADGGIIKSQITWISDCEYIMKMKKITVKDFPYKKGEKMNVRINYIIDNEFFYTSTVGGDSWRGKLIKISNDF